MELVIPPSIVSIVFIVTSSNVYFSINDLQVLFVSVFEENIYFISPLFINFFTSFKYSVFIKRLGFIGEISIISFKDFLNRVKLNKTAMISLIKSGAFDRLETETAKEFGVHPRIYVMAYYMSIVSEPKSKLTLQNFNGLIQRDLIPASLDFQKRVFNFNKYLKFSSKFLVP